MIGEELVFGIRTSLNPKLSKPLTFELEQQAIDRRRKFKSAGDEIAYRKSPGYLEKRAYLGRTTPEFGVVIQVGLLVPGGVTHIHAENPESVILEAFWSQFKDEYDTLFQYGLNSPLVGYGILDWTLPFLLKRSAILGIPIPRDIPLAKERNPAVYDVAINWERKIHPGGNLDFLSTAFDLEYDQSLESELKVVKQIYGKMKGGIR